MIWRLRAWSENLPSMNPSVPPFAEVTFCPSRTRFASKSTAFRAPAALQKVVPHHQILPLHWKVASARCFAARLIYFLCCACGNFKSPYIKSFSAKLPLKVYKNIFSIFSCPASPSPHRKILLPPPTRSSCLSTSLSIPEHWIFQPAQVVHKAQAGTLAHPFWPECARYKCTSERKPQPTVCSFSVAISLEGTITLAPVFCCTDFSQEPSPRTCVKPKNQWRCRKSVQKSNNTMHLTQLNWMSKRTLVPAPLQHVHATYNNGRSFT